MISVRSRLFSLGLIVVHFLLLSGCYYDNEEELYQYIIQPACDTADVSYSTQIQPILQQNCYGCHAKSLAFGNIVLEGYNQVSILAQSGRLVGAVSHDPAYSPMPKGGNSLPECEISLIKSWVNAGFPEN